MARILDADTSEIDRQHIERRVGRSLEDTTQSTDKGVGSIVVHGLQHQTSRATSAKRLHEGCGERTDKLVVQTAGSDTPGNALNEHIHRSRGTKHGHGHKDRHQIGDDADCSMKSVLGALDESIIDIDLLNAPMTMKVTIIPSKITLAVTFVTSAIVSLSICPKPQTTTPTEAMSPPKVRRSKG